MINNLAANATHLGPGSAVGALGVVALWVAVVAVYRALRSLGRR